MNIFNIISGTCSILGFLVSIFVASKVMKISKSNNNNSGTILQSSGKQEFAQNHSATGNASVIHKDYRNSTIIGEVDEMPELTKDKYDVSISNIDKYYDHISAKSCELIDIGNQDILIFSTDFANSQLREEQVQFIGYALKSLPMKDWRSFVNENYYLIFDYNKTGTINNFNIEITNSQLGKKILKKNLYINEGINTFELRLNDFITQIEDWKSVDEICFVFFLNECLGTYGTLTISSMRIEKK